MSETHNDHQHQHHHHHSHSHKHHVDDATLFQRRSLNSIKMQKLIAKWGLRVLLVIAILMVLATILVYNIR